MSKRSLNLSIDEKLYKAIKIISIEEGTTCSDLISEYIKAINKNKNVIKAIQDINKQYRASIELILFVHNLNNSYIT